MKSQAGSGGSAARVGYGKPGRGKGTPANKKPNLPKPTPFKALKKVAKKKGR